MRWRNATKVKRKKNIIVNAMEIAIKTGVVATGALNKSGAFPGSTDVSVYKKA